MTSTNPGTRHLSVVPNPTETPVPGVSSAGAGSCQVPVRVVTRHLNPVEQNPTVPIDPEYLVFVALSLTASSQLRLADAAALIDTLAGLSAGTYRSWCKSTAQPTLHQLQQVAGAIRRPVTDLTDPPLWGLWRDTPGIRRTDEGWVAAAH